VINVLKHVTLVTKKQFELIDITTAVKEAITESSVKSGIAVVFNSHTTAAIRANHNEPLLIQDIMKTLYRIVPLDVSYSHDLFEVRQEVAINERSNGHAHVKSFLFGSSETFIVEKGQLLLGAKQSIFFVELDGGRSRDYHIKIMGE
jgi:secondary thiamine-phosphate synthase enzyme